MKITKIINNNIVCSVDNQGNELIMTGCGLGFKQQVGNTINESKIEKTYKLENEKTSNKLQKLLSEIPLEYMNTCEHIISYAKEYLNKNLNENIYITLTDHINFAIERIYSDITYQNPLLWDIKSFYPNEYSVGMHSLKIIEDELGISLSENEAGFIALHLVNAELGTDMSSMFKITTFIQDVLRLVQEYYSIKLDEDSLYYERFITHLKFFGQRIFKNKEVIDDDYQFQDMIRKRYPKDYKCAGLIREYVQGKYNHKISEEEMIYLTVHLRRLTLTTEDDTN